MTNPLEENLHQPVMDVLGPENGEHWRARTRPAFALTSQESDGTVVGQLFGLPSLPADVPWPVREGHGPMTHLATIDCAELPQGVLDFDMPENGTLLFFRWSTADGERYFTAEGKQWGRDDEIYFMEGRGTDPGAGVKLLYVPAHADTAPRPHPDGDKCTDAQPLRLVGTFASRLMWELTENEYPVADDYRLADAFDEWESPFDVQIGGHQAPVQGPSVDKAAGGDLRGPYGAQADEGTMIMLATFYDYNDDVKASWFIEPRHLAQHRFDEIYYDYQC
ncbi:DUF1963 domain-containing protein [Streptomyces scopuliridis]|uniref:DUF1963 domain-containing protein n=1 Tax=Streptomyces scopuliridis TaxID=452529 RepID=UPI0036BDDD24